jgi:hypothetical protein
MVGGHLHIDCRWDDRGMASVIVSVIASGSGECDHAVVAATGGVAKPASGSGSGSGSGIWCGSGSGSGQTKTMRAVRVRMRVWMRRPLRPWRRACRRECAQSRQGGVERSGGGTHQQTREQVVPGACGLDGTRRDDSALAMTGRGPVLARSPLVRALRVRHDVRCDVDLSFFDSCHAV